MSCAFRICPGPNKASNSKCAETWLNDDDDDFSWFPISDVSGDVLYYHPGKSGCEKANSNSVEVQLKLFSTYAVASAKFLPSYHTQLIQSLIDNQTRSLFFLCFIGHTFCQICLSRWFHSSSSSSSSSSSKTFIFNSPSQSTCPVDRTSLSVNNVTTATPVYSPVWISHQYTQKTHQNMKNTKIKRVTENGTLKPHYFFKCRQENDILLRVS